MAHLTKKYMQAADSYFVDFRDVWLAYNDELRAKNQFAVEARRSGESRPICLESSQAMYWDW